MKTQLARLLVLLLAAASLAQAQEAADASPNAASDAGVTERDELEPAVPSSVLAEDVQRTSRGDRVMDELDLGRSEVTGNQELPKVLYIVPWQKADPGELMGKPVNTLLDEVLAPIDRSEFVRQVHYYEDLNTTRDE